MDQHLAGVSDTVLQVPCDSDVAPVPGARGAGEHEPTWWLPNIGGYLLWVPYDKGILLLGAYFRGSPISDYWGYLIGGLGKRGSC